MYIRAGRSYMNENSTCVTHRSAAECCGNEISAQVFGARASQLRDTAVLNGERNCGISGLKMSKSWADCQLALMRNEACQRDIPWYYYEVSPVPHL